MNRGGFSWNRLLGITRAKQRISRKIGIPLTRSGRQRKIGAMITGKGCLIAIIMRGLLPIILLYLILKTLI
jgi:hypothetical protein